MVNTDKLRGRMAEKRISGVDMAGYLGISPKGFYEKMKHGRFGLDDASVMIEVLDISDVNDIADIFFSKKVS